MTTKQNYKNYYKGYFECNPEKMREIRKRYYRKNKAKLKEKQKEYYWRQKDKERKEKEFLRLTIQKDNS